MRFIISGKNLNVTDGLRTAVQEKIGKQRDILLLKQKYMQH